jgi:peptidoglycan/xylan/chitin deacetylase (PgdA/CDA1 family)
MHRTRLTRIAVTAALLPVAALATAADDSGATRIARWKDDKACAFILMFDDSIPSHVKNVVPELAKRGFTGTFYINPGAGHYTRDRQAWEKDIPAAGFELANHTLTHRGGATTADIAQEIRACNAAIRASTPAMNWPRLVSWGQPGGIKPEAWPVSKDELTALLKENQLIARPDFGGRGAMIGLKTSREMLAHVDKAIAQGSMECIIFHGVGGEWINTPLPMFIELLDGMVGRRDRLWVTGHIPAHQYATERDAATVTVGVKAAAKISLTLACSADAKFYDQPLTLVTTLPSGWTTCSIDQGQRHAEARVSGGTVRYDALPGDEPIVITRK